MKYFLYFLLLPFLNTLASFIEDEINLLKVMDTLDNSTIVDGMDGYPAFAFDESNPLSTKLKGTSTDNRTISSPFILSTIFKLNKTKASCLFSIVEDGTLKIGMCLKPIAEEITKITVEMEGLTSAKKEVDFQYFGNMLAWTRILLHIEDTKVTLYVDCGYIDTSEYSMRHEDIQISGNSVLNLGHYGSGNRFFEGAIQELKLYMGATEEKLKSIKICSDVPIFPDSSDSDYDGDETPPEKLTEFTESSGIVVDTPVKGEKGEKGDPGTSIKGDMGPPGPVGPPGSPGKKGDDGTCSCSESVVSSLLKKMPEMRGPPGAQGPRGETGDPGKPGFTGKPGEQGERGPRGLKGEMGVRGEDGSPGKDGVRGEKGDPGSDGEMGPPGPQGPMGPAGPPGPKCKETEAAKVVATPGDKGEPGPIGPPGPMGPKGHPGDKGERGDKGDAGEKGQQGHPGPGGPRGEKGDRGHPGVDGLPGEPGAHGRPAEKGEKGNKGEIGDRGIPGLPAKLSSLLDPKDAEENAEIIEKLKGPKGDMGPHGERGEKGDIGPIGSIGPPGKDGHHGRPGEQGPRGKDGREGPTGPVGPKGEPGEPGPPGNGSVSSAVAIKGSKGEKGERGKDGSRGPIGKTGKPGSTGKRGLKGDSGAQGPVGPPGTCKDDKKESITVKGEKGDRGNDGKPGERGSPGLQGQCPTSCNSSAGPPGPPGVPGPPGLQGPPGVRGLKGEPGGSFAEKIYSYVTDGAGENQKYRDEDDEVYSTNTVIYRTKRALIKHTSSTPLGTLAYVLRENTFLLRNKNGWQYVVMGSILPMETSHRVTSTTYTPPLLHFESSTPPTPVLSSTTHSRPSRPYRTFIRLAALNEPYPGNMLTQTGMYGIKAANEACRRDSRKAGLKGTFVAFLANSNQYLRYLVGKEDEHLPVINVFDQVLFDRWIDMFNGTEAVLPENVNIYGFNHKNTFMDTSWPEKIIWHGGYANGSLAKNFSCNNWESNEGVGLASKIRINNRNNKLLGQEKFSCDNTFIVLCVESIARRSRHFESRYRDHFNRINRIPQS